MLDPQSQTSGAAGSTPGVNPSRDPLSSQTNRLRLIIADDDPVVASMLSLSLGEDFEVVGVAGDAEETVVLAGSTKPDVAIIDVDMPKGGGMHAVRGIRDACPQTAMVILSGDESDQLVRDLMSAGAVAYRRKGVDPHALADSLREAVLAHAAESRFTDGEPAQEGGSPSNGSG
jgi:DNA-binding NarL/FixJ family response regulator